MRFGCLLLLASWCADKEGEVHRAEATARVGGVIITPHCTLQHHLPLAASSH